MFAFCNVTVMHECNVTVMHECAADCSRLGRTRNVLNLKFKAVATDTPVNLEI